MVDEKRTDGLSRRTVVRVGAGAALAAGLPWRALAQSPPTGPGPNYAPHLKYALVDRITYGQNDAERKLFDDLGWDGYINYHLRPQYMDDSYCRNRLTEYSSLNYTPYHVRNTFDGGSWEAIGEVIESQIVRARYTSRQLLEVMVEFWSDHFNVYAYGEQWAETFPIHIATIRKYALTDFPTLLTQMARSTAMLGFLDNVDNTVYGGNENYARELMELHTMGADAGYTETEVETLQRCFTGWNMDYNEKNLTWGQFKYDPKLHNGAGGMFLGEKIPRGNQEQGDAVLMKLAAHPSTAFHIAQKLCRRFLGDNVPLATVQKVAAQYTKSGGNIQSMLRLMLRESSFKAWASTKYKRPFKYVMSALRASNAHITEGWALRWGYLSQMRQVPFEWAPPNGYPDHIAAWVDNIRPRWQFAQDMVVSNAWGVYCDLFGQLPSRGRDQVVDFCNKSFFGGTLPADRLALIASYLSSRPTNAQIREIIGLAMSMPEFQYC